MRCKLLKLLGVLFVLLTPTVFIGFTTAQPYIDSSKQFYRSSEFSVGDALLYEGTTHDVLNDTITQVAMYKQVEDFPYEYTKIYDVIDSLTSKSFLITGFNLPEVIANTTERHIQTYNYHLEEYWDPYPHEDGSITFTPSGNYTFEKYMNETYCNIYSGPYNSTSATIFDFTYLSDEAYYAGNYNITLTINNAKREINVDEYHIHQENAVLTPQTKFDVDFDANYTDITDISILVDSATKLIVKIEQIEYHYYWYSITKFSNTYNTTLDLERFQENWFYTTLVLSESTFGYGSWQDADLPAIYFVDNVYDLTITNNQDIHIPIYVSDTSPISLNVYIDGYYWNSYRNISGSYNLSIPEIAFIPNLECSCNIIAIIADDGYGHSTYWSLTVEDNRPFNASWSPWIEAPDYVELNSSARQVTANIYSSTVWWANIYFKENDSWIKFEDYYGYKNSTISFSMNIFLPGTFEIMIELFDYSNNSAQKVMTVKYDPFDLDTEPPVIVGPSGNLTIQQGEEQELIWSIDDDHLSLIELYVNSSLKLTIAPTTDYYELKFDTLSIAKYPGTYIVTIIAYDVNNLTASQTVTIKVVPLADENSSTTSNTEIFSTNSNISTGKVSFAIIFSTILLITATPILTKKKK